MNEQVLKDLYNRAVTKGYQKSIEDFSLLLEKNNDVLNDNYNYVKEQGYEKSIEEFSTLVGVKKKRRFRAYCSRGRYGIHYTGSSGRSYLIGCFSSNTRC